MLNLALAFLGCWHWDNVALLEEVEQLARDLLKSLLGQLGWVVLEVAEGHELHNICLHVLLVPLRVERYLVSVEDVHAFEIIGANTNNNYRYGQAAASHDLVNSLLHIVDDAIGDD